MRLFTDNIDWTRFVVLLRERFFEYTQKELSDEVGVDPNTVAKWEQGKSTPRRPNKRKL
ncbi:MAG: helix-turn-helix domain-containing protein, partial [Candidatus Eisenbacteria bacterium]|nr:helix-turn-helix domain-containing protein [Candidatus Eisenbacteria bacterium]